MSGVVACCCTDATGPTVCQCQCVCDHYFSAFDQDFPGEFYIGLWQAGNLLPATQGTLVWWTNECGNFTEWGVHWHQYTHPQSPTTALVNVVDNTNPDLAGDWTDQIGQMEMRNDAGNVVSTAFGPTLTYPGAQSGCKMRVLRWRQIRDSETGFFVPEVGTSVFIDDQTVIYESVVNGTAPEPTENFGFDPVGEQRTFINGHFPRGDPRYNPNLEETGACISNIMTFSGWLENNVLLALWQNGIGAAPEDVIELPENIDQWCSPDPNWQQVGGLKAGTIVKHHGALWSGVGDHITDGKEQFISAIS